MKKRTPKSPDYAQALTLAVRTGEHCPRTGWWQPVQQQSADSEATLLFVGQGSVMPAVAGGALSIREAVRKGPSTQDYLDAIGDTRTTVSAEVHQDFLEDIDALGRM